ncbi:hypothetical protein [Pseudoduganella sp. RAF53_2]|uniref:hypothetical protein n=1 Tax=unclassified Pseudoduganella TaxID=2637179 RepID=UPI003F9BD7D7
MLSVLIGIALAIGVGLLGTYIKLDRERGFYPVILIVVAAIYVLFACCANEPRVVFIEILPLAVFGIAAVVGFRKSQWIVVVGLAGHGCFDAVHNLLILNKGVPPWWPEFCGTFDVVFALYFGVRLVWSKRKLSSSSSEPHLFRNNG